MIFPSSSHATLKYHDRSFARSILSSKSTTRSIQPVQCVSIDIEMDRYIARSFVFFRFVVLNVSARLQSGKREEVMLRSIEASVRPSELALSTNHESSIFIWRFKQAEKRMKRRRSRTGGSSSSSISSARLPKILDDSVAASSSIRWPCDWKKSQKICFAYHHHHHHHH